MIRTEESKHLWKLAEAARDWEAMEAIERQWALLAEPIPDYSQDEQYIWEGEDEADEYRSEMLFSEDRDDWTDEDEAELEEYEERKRQRIAEANEY